MEGHQPDGQDRLLPALRYGCPWQQPFREAQEMEEWKSIKNRQQKKVKNFTALHFLLFLYVDIYSYS